MFHVEHDRSEGCWMRVGGTRRSGERPFGFRSGLRTDVRVEARLDCGQYVPTVGAERAPVRYVARAPVGAAYVAI